MNARFLRNVFLKGLLLFAIFNLLWTLVNPDGLGKLSLYNVILSGRERLPFGEDSSQSYNLSLYNVDAMFASIKLTGSPKPANEFRVFVIGDSSVWGTLLKPEETLAGLLDSAGLTSGEGRVVRVYNLGYPTLSLTKDLMILDEAMQYQPDLILWPVTLESFPRDRQLESPIVANNAGRVASLISRYHLDLKQAEDNSTFWQRTILGERRSLADLLRLQIYGVMWSATGIDQTYPAEYERAARDLKEDETFNGWKPAEMSQEALAFDVLAAGIQRAGEVPVVIINEPILVSTGENSDVRYNFYYPRWAYDQYRDQLFNECSFNEWNCLDLWNSVPQERFTNSAIHLDPQGEGMLAQKISSSEIFEQVLGR
jgi:hypothetical protein